MTTQEILSHMPEKPIDAKSAEEISPLKEKYRLKVGFITITSQPGAGGTTLAKALAEELGITNIFGVGLDLRKFIRETTGQEIIGDVDRDPEVDYILDNAQADIMRQAISGNPWIIDSKLGPIIADEVTQEAEEKGISIAGGYKIQVFASREIREQRLQKRHPDRTPEEIREQTQQREEGHVTRWAANHPQIIAYNPWEPNPQKSNGEYLYDCSINSEVVALVEEEVKLVIQKGLELGKIEKTL